MSILEIIQDEADQIRAERKKHQRSFDLLFPFDPILDGVDLVKIFKLDHPSNNQHNGLYHTTDVDKF